MVVCSSRPLQRPSCLGRGLSTQVTFGRREYGLKRDPKEAQMSRDVLCTNLPSGRRPLFRPCCNPGWRTDTHPSQRIPRWPTYGLPNFGLLLQLHMGQVGGYDHVGRGGVTAATCKASSWLGRCRLGVFGT